MGSCLPACLCLAASLPACLPASLPTYLPLCLPASLPASACLCLSLPLPAAGLCLPACLCRLPLACFCLPASPALPACPACLCLPVREGWRAGGAGGPPPSTAPAPFLWSLPCPLSVLTGSVGLARLFWERVLGCSRAGRGVDRAGASVLDAPKVGGEVRRNR